MEKTVEKTVEPKKRGRKPKEKMTEESREPKKRGRKPKEKMAEEPREPKKRGRKPKAKIYSVSHEPVLFNIDNISENLLHLEKVKKSDLEKAMDDTEKVKQFEPYEKDFMPFKSFGTEVEAGEKNELMDNELEPSKKRVIFKKKRNLRLLPELYDNIDNWPKSTELHCWWCCYEFSGMPLPLPLQIVKDRDTGTDKIRVKGVFCSFNCMKAYEIDIGRSHKSLVYYFFKRMNKIESVVTKGMIKAAPSKYLLDIFGGPLSIEEFRQNFHDSERFNLLPYPMMAAQQFIEHVNPQDIKIKNVNEKVEKRLHDNIIKHKESKKVLKSDVKLSKNTLEHLMSMQIN
jgi:hypothetical protein